MEKGKVDPAWGLAPEPTTGDGSRLVLGHYPVCPCYHVIKTGLSVGYLEIDTLGLSRMDVCKGLRVLISEVVADVGDGSSPESGDLE